MKVVKPIQINPLNLVSSNVPIDDAPEWASTTTYAVGNPVVYQLNIYESLIASNTGNIPGSVSPDGVPKWLNKGPVNRWKMFNKRQGNKWLGDLYTENEDSIDFTVRPGEVVNSIGIVGSFAQSIQIIMTIPGASPGDPDQEVYNQSFDMVDTTVSNWYDYWFSPIARRANFSIFNLPAYSNADIRVIASSPGSVARIGTFIIGRLEVIGGAVYGTSLGYTSYSRTTEDDFGNITITPRGSRRFVDFDIRVETPRISYVMQLLDSLRDTASLYVGSDDIDATIIVGRFERLQSVLTNVAYCEMNLEVRSLE